MKNLIISAFVVVAFLLGAFAFRVEAPRPVGSFAPSLSGDSIINGSSTLAGYGAVLFTNASNTGEWFRISNGSGTTTFWCGAVKNATTTGLLRAGIALRPTSTDFYWEAHNIRGDIGCVPDASGSAIMWSYSGR